MDTTNVLADTTALGLKEEQQSYGDKHFEGGEKESAN